MVQLVRSELAALVAPRYGSIQGKQDIFFKDSSQTDTLLILQSLVFDASFEPTMEAFPSSPPPHFAKWHPSFKKRIELVIIKLISAMVSGLDHLAK